MKLSKHQQWVIEKMKEGYVLSSSQTPNKIEAGNIWESCHLTKEGETIEHSIRPSTVQNLLNKGAIKTNGNYIAYYGTKFKLND